MTPETTKTLHIEFRDSLDWRSIVGKSRLTRTATGAKVTHERRNTMKLCKDCFYGEIPPGRGGVRKCTHLSATSIDLVEGGEQHEDCETQRSLGSCGQDGRNFIQRQDKLPF